MRELARVQLRFAHKPFAEMWNKTSDTKIELGSISLYRDSEEYERLSASFREFYSTEKVDWIEWIEVEYSEEELRNPEILVLHVNGYAGSGGNTLAEVYEDLNACSACGSLGEIHQVGSIVLDQDRSSPEALDVEDPQTFGHDICRTDFDDEIIVTQRVRELMESYGITGVEFRRVIPMGASETSSSQYCQLIILDRIGPMVPPTRLVYEKLCPECGRHRKVLIETPTPYLVSPDSEPYFERHSYAGQDIMLSTTRLKAIRSPIGKRLIIASQRMYGLLRENGVTGFWAQPAHLV